MTKKITKKKKCPISWWKRIGVLSFWFFFIKGMTWMFGLIAIYIYGENVFKNIHSYILALL